MTRRGLFGMIAAAAAGWKRPAIPAIRGRNIVTMNVSALDLRNLAVTSRNYAPLRITNHTITVKGGRIVLEEWR